MNDRDASYAGDSVVRAMTDDGAFRVIVARTTETVRGVIASQSARGSTAEQFGDLITGAVLVRETMAPTLRVQAIVKGARGRGSMVADAHPSGATRGLVQLPGDATEFDFANGALLQVMRSLPKGSIHQGVVEVADAGDISRALMEYMQSSEQVASMIAVATVFEDSEVLAAGGYIVQLLPEVGREPLRAMTERLVGFESITALLRERRPSPDALLGELLLGMPYTRLEESAVRFECQCSQVRVVLSLSTLSRADLDELVSAGEVLEIGCDYCGKQYRVTPGQLRGLLEQS